MPARNPASPPITSKSLPRLDPAARPAVLIDFSAPAATRALLPLCVQCRKILLIGTTGLASADQAIIDDAAKSIPILQATNTSLGVNVLLSLVAQAARQLGPDYDIEIVEAHHNQKIDAPSGTALSLAQSITTATNRSLDQSLVHGRHGPEAKPHPRLHRDARAADGRRRRRAHRLLLHHR